MPFEPILDRRSFLQRAAIVGAGASTVGLLGSFSAPAAHAATYAHPGLLHTGAGLADLVAKAGSTTGPWASGLDALTADARSRSDWTADPAATLELGGADANFDRLLDDAHAAYQNALLSELTGDTARADTAVDVLNAWSETLTAVSGTAPIGQAAGLYAFLLANAAELVRDHAGFDSARFATMLKDVLHPVSDAYLTGSGEGCASSYETNWRLSHIASVLATGVFCDDSALVDQATGFIADSPAIMNSLPYGWDGGASDRYSVTGLGLLAAVCETAWSQDIDLYSSHGDRLLAAGEEVARYGEASTEVPSLGTWGTSATPPVWVLLHDHYVTRKGLSAPGITALAEQARAEGGGFDRLGLGGLAYSL